MSLVPKIEGALKFSSSSTLVFVFGDSLMAILLDTTRILLDYELRFVDIGSLVGVGFAWY